MSKKITWRSYKLHNMIFWKKDFCNHVKNCIILSKKTQGFLEVNHPPSTFHLPHLQNDENFLHRRVHYLTSHLIHGFPEVIIDTFTLFSRKSSTKSKWKQITQRPINYRVAFELSNEHRKWARFPRVNPWMSHGWWKLLEQDAGPNEEHASQLFAGRTHRISLR